MNAVGLAIGGVFLLAMIGISTWAWRSLPPDVRIPVHAGIGGYNNYWSKKPALLIWPVTGVVIYGLFFGAFEGFVPHHGSTGTAVIIVPIVLAVVLVAQAGAIRAAFRQPISR
jgi:hypothetical protein